jgi:hypothetical protein
MSYAVEWSRDAINQLAELWLSATDREAITRAQAEIDAALSSRPHGGAVHVSEGLYRLRAKPIQVMFENCG